MAVSIRQLQLGSMGNFVYLIACSQTREAIVVDPAWQIDTVFKEAQKEGLIIKSAILTHTHYDHVNGVSDLLHELDIPIYVHHAEYDFLDVAGSNRRKTKEGDKISLGKINLDILHTPGHSAGSQCIRIENYLISGDTLFVDDCGRTDLPGGDVQQMFQSLSRLKALPDETILFPGHHYSSVPSAAMRIVKRSNLALRAASIDEFLKMMGKTG